jgi:WbqC-like protein family
MKIAISQPTYLPWLGYFDLIDQVDAFVLLDSVQFEKQSWQQRNRIKTPTGLQWLTVPVVFRGRLEQRIMEVVIRDPEFPKKHIRAIELNYRRAPFFDHYFPAIARVLEDHAEGSFLVDLNIEFVRWCCTELNVRTPLVRSSELNQSGRRSELLVNLCRCLNADTYVSTPGSATYLLNDLRLFADAGINVSFQNFEHPTYRQMFPPFVPYASVLDVLFNEGENLGQILRSGRRPAITPDELSINTIAGVGA